MPPLSGSGWPTWVVPLKKVTFPVGVPLPDVGFTVADKVTPLVAPTSTDEGVTMAVVVVEVLFAATARLNTVPQGGFVQAGFPPY